MNPLTMVTEDESAMPIFEEILQVLLNAGWYTVSECDNVLPFSLHAGANHEVQDFVYI